MRTYGDQTLTRNAETSSPTSKVSGVSCLGIQFLTAMSCLTEHCKKNPAPKKGGKARIAGTPDTKAPLSEEAEAPSSEEAEDLEEFLERDLN